MKYHKLKTDLSKKTELQQEYEYLWYTWSRDIADSKYAVELCTSTEMKTLRGTLSLIVRVGYALNDTFFHIVKALHERYPEHYFYPRSDLHFTVTSLCPFVSDPHNLTNSELNRVAHTFAGILASYHPWKVEFAGLSVSPSSTFIQVFDCSGTIALLRRELCDVFSQSFWRPILYHQFQRLKPDLLTINFIRYGKQVERDWIEVISQYRDIDFGSCTITEIELVTTDRLLSKSNTTVERTYHLHNIGL